MAMQQNTSRLDEAVLRGMKDALNKQMTETAEPILQAAVKEFERALRERLAASLISMIDGMFSMERYGHDLRITIRREPPAR